MSWAYARKTAASGPGLSVGVGGLPGPAGAAEPPVTQEQAERLETGLEDVVQDVDGEESDRVWMRILADLECDTYRVRVFPTRRWGMFGRWGWRTQIDHVQAWVDHGDLPVLAGSGVWHPTHHQASRWGIAEARRIHADGGCQECGPRDQPLVIYVGAGAAVDERPTRDHTALDAPADGAVGEPAGGISPGQDAPVEQTVSTSTASAAPLGRDGEGQLSAWWVSWWHATGLGGFELHSPWWVSGFRDGGDGSDADSVCAAVMAATADGAREVILSSYDERPADLEWRFVEQPSACWSPFSDRFPRADWMRWPVEGGDR